MRKEDKTIAIENIATTINEYAHFYLVDVEAMDAEATSKLRRKCFEKEIKLMVVKNKLLHKALESLEIDFSPLYIITDFPNSILHKNALFSLILLFVILLSSPQTIQLPTYTILSISIFYLSSIDIFA